MSDTGDMRLRLSTALACLLLVVVSSCGDATEVRGTYAEEIDQLEVDTAGMHADTFATRLDLFQFGDQVGGIVRYYSLRTLEKNPTLSTPFFDANEVLCMPANPRTVVANDFSLSFLDDLGQNKVLSLSRRSSGLAGTISVFDPSPVRGAQKVFPRNIEFQTLNGDTDNTCTRGLEGFNLSLMVRELRPMLEGEVAGDLCDGRCAVGQCDPTTGACFDCVCANAGDVCDGQGADGVWTCTAAEGCLVDGTGCDGDTVCSPRTHACVSRLPSRVVAGIVWVDDGRVVVQDWTYALGRDQTAVDTGRVVVERNLRPGRWFGTNLEALTHGDVALGLVMVYLDPNPEAVSAGGEISGTQSAWSRRKLLVGTTLAPGSDTTEGRAAVLIYLGRDPSELSEDFLSLLEDDELPRAGYNVFWARYNLDTGAIVGLQRTSSRTVEVHARQWTEFTEPLDRLSRTLPRLDFQ